MPKIDHLVNRHRQSILVPVNRHPQTVANANNIDTSTLGPLRREEVSNRHHDQPLTIALLLRQIGQGEPFPLFSHRCSLFLRLCKLVLFGTIWQNHIRPASWKFMTCTEVAGSHQVTY